MSHLNYVEVDFWKRKFFGSEALLKAAMAGKHQQLSSTEKKLLTKELLEVISIETLTYCNRKCDYCPVAQSDFRQSRAAQKQISPALYQRIINDLAEIDYDKLINITGYSEPLYNEDLPELIKYARQKCPRASLLIFSNADLLDHAMFLKLLNAGLNKIIITIHPAPHKPLTKKELVRRVKQLFKRLRFEPSEDDFNTWLAHERHCEIMFMGMSLRIQWQNLRELGTWRGGIFNTSMSPELRTKPCLLPFREMVVFFDGTVINCCHAYYDPTWINERQQQCLIDVVSETTSIFDAFCHEKFNRFRRHLFGYQEKKGICSRCSYVDVTDGSDKEKRENILAELAKEDAKDAMIFVEPNRTEPNRAEPSQNKIVRREMNFPADIFFAKAFFRQSANIWRKKNPADKNAFLLLHF